MSSAPEPGRRGSLLVLVDVREHPGIGLAGLCGRTDLKKSAASKLVDALVGKGFLLCAEAEGDRRAIPLMEGPALGEADFCSAKSLRSIFPALAEAGPEAGGRRAVSARPRRQAFRPACISA